MIEAFDFVAAYAPDCGNEDWSSRLLHALGNRNRQVAAAGNNTQRLHQTSSSMLAPRFRIGAIRRFLSARMKSVTCCTSATPAQVSEARRARSASVPALS